MEARILAASLPSAPERALPLRASDALRRSPLGLCWPAVPSKPDAAAEQVPQKQSRQGVT